MASGSKDKTIFLWNTPTETATRSGFPPNYGVLQGHKNAVTSLVWNRDSSHVISGSADKTVALWDSETGARIRKHNLPVDSEVSKNTSAPAIVNVVDVVRRGNEIYASGSDDGMVVLWDPRQKHAIDYISNEFPILAVSFTSTGSTLFSSGINPDIDAWDLRNFNNPIYSIESHVDSVTSLQVCPNDDSFLVSNSFDNTVKTHDIKPFVVNQKSPEQRNQNRTIASYYGSITGGIEQKLIKCRWSNGTGENLKIISGSNDATTVIWDFYTRKLAYKLPGHSGIVNDVDWHPYEDVIVSASADRTLLISEVAK